MFQEQRLQSDEGRPLAAYLHGIDAGGQLGQLDGAADGLSVEHFLSREVVDAYLHVGIAIDDERASVELGTCVP